MGRTTEMTLPVGRVRFIQHDGWSRTVPTLERFADRMTTHGNLHLAAGECGISNDYAESLRTRLRKLGVNI